MSGKSDFPSLLQYGITTTSLSWHLLEAKPAGYCRIYYVKNRAVRYEDEFGAVNLNPGTLYVLPSTLPYQAGLTGDEPFECTFLHVDFFPHSVTRLVEIPVENNGMLHHYLTAIEKCVYLRDREMVSALTAALNLILSRTPYFNHPSPFMHDMLLYISAHLSEDISVKKLSEITKYHPNYFIGLFKSESGLTPHQYILRLRMQKARTLLLDGERVAEASAEVGYSDAASFARAFRAVYGISPQKCSKRNDLVP